MNVSVIGTGYVGLVSGVCLAEKGHQVVCVDLDRGKVDSINQGRAPIYEKGLDELLRKNIGARLRATTDLHAAVHETEISIVAVGTPFNGSKIDLTSVENASRQIGSSLKSKEDYHVVVIKSTVVPGTTDGRVGPLLEETSGKIAGMDFGLGMNPEFLRQGEAVDDFMHPDRIVLGGMDDRTLAALDRLYDVFTDVDKIRTINRTAEMIKYTANSLLATLISFSNEIGNLCATTPELDVVDVMRGVILDKRFSPIQPDGTRITPSVLSYLEAGCGFGGSCFPKDVKALIAYGNSSASPMHMLSSVIRVNEAQPLQVISLLHKHFPSLKNIRVAILGLAFKPGTDDVRESPAIPIIRTLQREGARVKAFDPAARHEAEKVFNGYSMTYSEHLEHAVADVDAVVLLTKWPEFNILPELLARAEPAPVFIDGRRMLDKKSIRRYEGIGL